MPGSAVPPVADPPATTVERFSGATRAFHWAVALPFVLLLLSGLALYLPAVRQPHVGAYRLVPLLHVLAGFGLLAVIPLVVALARRRRALVTDLRAALTPETGDGDWLRWSANAALGALAEPPAAGKYNAGQKLATAAWLALTLGLLASGVVLGVNYFSMAVFDFALVERVFPWHTWLAWLSLPLLAGHLYFALLHPPTRHALRGMLGGRVRRDWAAAHHRRWLDEVERQ